MVGPRRNSENPDFQQMINDSIAAAIPTIVAQVTQNLNPNHNPNGAGGSGSGGAGGSGSGGAGGSGAGGTEPPARGCKYQEFMSCKPKEFWGTEGAVGIVQWIENLESVLDISECADNNKVKFASGCFQGSARTWWNSVVQTRGRENINMLNWEDLKFMLMTEYCPRNEMQRIKTEFWNLKMIGTEYQAYTSRFHELARLVPHLVTPEAKRIERYIWGLEQNIRPMVMSSKPATFQEAVSAAGSLTYDLIRSGVLTAQSVEQEAGEKRKRDDQNDSRGNRKKQQYAIVAAATTNNPPATTSNYLGKVPQCNKCKFHHHGECPVCNLCQKTGHIAKYCNTKAGILGSCYECGEAGHYRNRCPKLKRAPIVVPPARGRAYFLGNTDAAQQKP